MEVEIDWKACGKRVRDIRKKIGLSQEQLAEEIDIASNSVSRIENGQPTQISTLYKISKILRVSVDYLLDGTKVYMDTAEIKAVLQDKEEINHQLANCFHRQLRYIAKSLLPTLLLRDDFDREQDK